MTLVDAVIIKLEMLLPEEMEKKGRERKIIQMCIQTQWRRRLYIF